MDALRRRLAEQLGVGNHNRISLGANATWGLNLAIFGLGLQAGDWVLTTKAEHNSVLRPLHQLAACGGVRVHYLDTDDQGRVPAGSWQAAVDWLRPKLCIFSHASNVTGAVNDAASLTAAAHRQGAKVLIDLAQSLGWLEIGLESWGADMAAFTGHKYLLGPQGTGGLYVRDGLELVPHLVGGTGIHSDSDLMPAAMPLHLEAGTGNEPGAYGLLAALDWARANPVATARPTTYSQLSYIKQALQQLGADIIAPEPPCTPVLSFAISGISPANIGSLLLDSYDIIVRTGLHCAPRIFECLAALGQGASQGSVRVSLSRFTSEQDVEELVAAMFDIVTSELGRVRSAK